MFGVNQSCNWRTQRTSGVRRSCFVVNMINRGWWNLGLDVWPSFIRQRVQGFICGICVRSQSLIMFLFFTQMKMDERFQPWKWKVLQVNSGLYFHRFVHLAGSNIIREIQCQVIYLFIHLINHLRLFWILNKLGRWGITGLVCPV